MYTVSAESGGAVSAIPMTNALGVFQAAWQPSEIVNPADQHAAAHVYADAAASGDAAATRRADDSSMITRPRVVIAVLVLMIALFMVTMASGGRSSFDFDHFDFEGLRSQLFGSTNSILPDDSSPASCFDRSSNSLSFGGGCDLSIAAADNIPQPDNPRSLRLTLCAGDAGIELTNDPKGLEINTTLPQGDQRSLDFNIFHEGETTIRLNCTGSDTCEIALNDAPCPTEQP